MNRRLTKVLKSEKGQALIVVLILMVLGGLIIVPCLNYVATSLNTGQVYKATMALIYAADAGVEDALWGIKNETVPIGPFDYETVFTYSLPEEVNDKAVEVSIQQIWPLSGLETDAHGTTSSNHLTITGGIVDEEAGGYKVQMSYDGAAGDLLIDRVGVWFPPGFDYVTGSSSGITTDDPTILDWHGGKALEWDFQPAVNFINLPVPPPPEPPPGGGFTPAEEYPAWRTLTFNVSPIGELANGTYTWVRTTNINLYLSWDTNYSNYKINSTATDVAESKSYSVESYSYLSKGSLSGGGDILFRGNYRAIGQTLETYSVPPGSHPKRDVLLPESSSTISATNIPDDAEVIWAYLYWSAMFAGTEEQTLFEDSCANMGKWVRGSDWTVSSGRFSGHHSGSESNRYLTMLNSLDLSAAPSGSTKVSWDQSKSGSLQSGDCLKFQFSSNGGTTWGSLITAFCGGNPSSSFSYTIPSQYLTTGNFKMRFYLGGFSDSGKYCYIDNISITATLTTTVDTSVKFKVNGQQVYFNELGQPTVGGQDITASKWWIKDNSDVSPNTYSYSCFKDVTALIKLISPRGNGTYTVGDVYGTLGYETSYAGWSLIIVYSSPSEQVHNIYLYDNFLFADQYTSHTFTIQGFQAPEGAEAKLTCFVGEGDPQYGDFQMGRNDRDYIEFNGYPLPHTPDGVNSQNNVWNSESSGLGGEAISGVDIDAFDVSSPIIQPGATWANVKLGTGYDVWNLVYIILSFRSNISGGLAPNSVGSITYSCGGGS